MKSEELKKLLELSFEDLFAKIGDSEYQSRDNEIIAAIHAKSAIQNEESTEKMLKATELVKKFTMAIFGFTALMVIIGVADILLRICR